MKLSMWMVVNRLHNLDIEVQISDKSEINLRSARRAYATDCIHVYQHGEDVICKSGSDYFILKDLDSHEASEIVQSVFDYYDDWEYAILEAARKLDFQSIIDKSWHIFHNPIVLMDANSNVVAISKHYTPNELDDEWHHLCEYGSSSLDVFSYLKNDRCNNFEVEGAHYYKMSNPRISNCISSMISYRHASCGRISVLEVDRELNRGDLQIIDYLVNTISVYMGVLGQNSDNNYFSIFQNLLNGQQISEEKLLHRMEYMKWKIDDDNFEIYTVTPCRKQEIINVTRLLKGQIERVLPECEILTFDNSVVIISNTRTSPKNVAEKISQLGKESDFIIGRSLEFYDIHLCKYFYNQAKFAINCEIANRLKGETAQNAVNFYDYAIEFIIKNHNEQELLYACHADIMRLWIQDVKHNTDRLYTFSVYLNNERSLLNAAQELYVHRNTLVYRINKIFEQLTCDLNDVYTRAYMKLSVRIIKLFGKNLKIH